MYFKVLLSVIIPKPNKVAYNFPKSFYLIILLNMLDRLIEKVISQVLFEFSKLIWMNEVVSNQMEL